MKKTTLAAMALLCCTATATPAMAQEMSPTSSLELYDFSGWNDEKILDLFYNAIQDGREYPTLEEFASIGIQESDIALVRSHVRYREIMDRSNSITPNTYKERNLWMNLPIGTSSKLGGFPNANFANDVYSAWNYTNVFGSWNHALFQSPGSVMDCAHRNGTYMYSGVRFFDTTGNPNAVSAKDWIKFITTPDPSGNYTYKYTKPMINCLLYFGQDGINYNWEDGGYDRANVVDFHRSLYKEAERVGFKSFHIGIYNGLSFMSEDQAHNFIGDEKGRVSDFMMNYGGGGDFTGEYDMEDAVTNAENVCGSTEGLYAGVWIVTMQRSWDYLPAIPKIGICLWGEHSQSRFFSENSGADAFEAQENYQRVLERAVSGGNRNPLNLPEVDGGTHSWGSINGNPPLYQFPGLATFVAERSAIQGNLPFSTHFTLGNGDRYFYKGKATLPSAWYNMGAQDVVPTYRWYIADANTAQAANNIEVNYMHKDAYIGGSCIRLTGQSTAAGTDIVLYNTNLKVAGSAPYAKVAVKNLKEGNNPSNLYVILKKAGADSWIEVPYGDVNGKNWEEKTLEISGLAQGETIEKIGLRVKGDDSDYKLLVGKLEINDHAADVLPAPIQDLKVEVRQETKTSLSVKAFWTVDQTTGDFADYGTVYNDEANIDHFELLYKIGENGKVSEIARTTTWSDVIGNLYFAQATDEPYIGVRSVSTDLKNVSPIKWVKVTRAAADQLPEAQVEDTYGKSELDPGCENADKARKTRYIAELNTKGATKNLDYTANAPVADGTQYANCTDQVLEVEQGQEIELFFKAADLDDGLQYCFVGGWMDFDGSGNFNHPSPSVQTDMRNELGDPLVEDLDPLGECVFKMGRIKKGTPKFQKEGVSCKFTIPADAHVGQSRLRIVFSDAWFAGQFTPSGLTWKGFTIDFGVKINGNEANQRGAVDTRDQGIAEEPENMEAIPTAIEEVAHEVSTAVVNGRVLSLNNVEKAWIYSADGKFVKLAENTDAVSLEGLVPGAYLVKMLNKNVFRSSKFIVK